MLVLGLVLGVACRDGGSPTDVSDTTDGAGLPIDSAELDDSGSDGTTLTDSHMESFGCEPYWTGTFPFNASTDPERFHYVANVIGASNDGELVLDCTACATPLLETHPLPYDGLGGGTNFIVALSYGPYSAGRATEIGCLLDTEHEGEFWSAGIRTAIDGVDVCFRVVSDPAGSGDDFVAPDRGCVEWPW